MTKALLAALLLAAVVQPAQADDRFLRFQGGIGVHPLSNGVAVPPTLATAAVVENVTRNIVRGVQPPGQPWVIADLKADIRRSDGQIRVNGRGLLLAGGNNVGLNGGASVFATLICETAAPFVQRNTSLDGVALEPDGDFRIDDMLSPWPPDSCSSPVLLIRTTGGTQGWFAAGIPKR
jgi:hypothetical protein